MDFRRKCHGALHPIGMVIGWSVLAVGLAFAFGWVVMLLWNWLMPPIFHLGVISYWQGFGLVLLTKLLFGGMHMGHHKGGKKHGCRGHGHMDWKKKHTEHLDMFGENWKPAGSHHNWRFYTQYWKEEGKNAFEDYLKRKNLGDKPAE